MEHWKGVEGFPNYEVSDEGRVRNCRTGLLLKQFANHKGYPSVSLFSEGKARNFRVHRLVALAFVPNPADKPTVNHLDGKKVNNRAANLAWASMSEQMLHAYDNGLAEWTYARRANASVSAQRRWRDDPHTNNFFRPVPPPRKTLELDEDGWAITR